MLSVVRYSQQEKDAWNSFNASSKNPLFMFDRNYMDYHSERFADHSLMFYDENRLIALLPMNEAGEMLVSHGGLTYGGFITDAKMKQRTMNTCFDLLTSYAREKKIGKILYKSIPHIYHTQPAEEDKYALFINGAKIEKVESSTVINLKQPIKMTKGRRAQISRARREGVVVHALMDDSSFYDFICLENAVLAERHNTKAVHTGAELAMLHSRFPEHMHLYGAFYENALIAGVLIFEYEHVIHTQYMAANDLACSIGALDLTIDTIIEKYKESKKWLDFGISTEDAGHKLNEGLISQKEGFGGRTNVYETYMLFL